MIVVSDTSPITNLLKIGRLPLLREIFQRVIIPEKVEQEIQAWKTLGADITAFERADWIETRRPTDLRMVQGLLTSLDEGEAAAIALAHELKADYLLIDERRGWQLAKSMGIPAIGLIGVLLNAKRLGLLPAVMPVIDDLRDVAGFWLIWTVSALFDEPDCSIGRKVRDLGEGEGVCYTDEGRVITRLASVQYMLYTK